MTSIQSKNDIQAIAEGCYYDPVAAERAVRFIETYVVPTSLGHKILLLPWQKEIVSDLFGWFNAQGGWRYRVGVVSTAKKNGRTILGSAILAYALYGRHSQNPFVCSASTSRENAGQVFRELSFSVENSPALRKISKSLISKYAIRVEGGSPPMRGLYRSLTSSPASQEGENLLVCIADEMHAHVSNKLWQTLRYASIARPSGLILAISTVGADMSHFFYDIFTYAQRVQSDDIIDTQFYSKIYCPDSTDEIDNPATWYKSNPSLSDNGFLTVKQFERDLHTAKMGGAADLSSFKRYRLNIWQNKSDEFIDLAKWDQLKEYIPDADLKNCNLTCAVDASQAVDPTCVAMVWSLGDGRYYTKCHAWCAEQGFKRNEKSLTPKYLQFQSEGWLTMTAGQFIDEPQVKQFILDCRAKGNLQMVVFDQANMIPTALSLINEHKINCYRQPQNKKYFTSPIKDFHRLVETGAIKHDGNSMLRWSLAQTQLEIDQWGNCCPIRGESTNKIDHSVAVLMALAQAMQSDAGNVPFQSVYETSTPLLI